MIGRTVGNYVIKEKIGEGGMGAVYLAEHPRIGRRVAVKVLLPQYSQDPQAVGRFFNEARAAHAIRNDHIIEILDFGELAEGGGSYLVMEYLQGRSLTDVILSGRLSVERSLHIGRGISSALAAAHAHGIVHRDLKPDNIFLVRRGEDPDFVKVLDFGIAKLSDDGGPQVKTRTGTLIGTPLYMSPEQCRGQSVDSRTDIYALGVILYEMLTGQVPFNGEGLGELLLQHMTQRPRPPRELQPQVPEAVEAAVLRALDKDPAARPARVEELLGWLDGEAVAAVPTPDPAPQPGSTALPGGPQPTADTLADAAAEQIAVPRRTSPSLLIAGLVLIAGVGVGGWLLLGGGRTAPAPPALPGALPVSGSPTAKEASAAPPPAAAEGARTAGVAPGPTGLAVAAAAPDELQLSIRVTPAEAEIRLDAAPLPNPFSGSFRRDELRHRLEVSAPQHQPHMRWLLFDRDQTLEISLDRLRRKSPALPSPAAKGEQPPQEAPVVEAPPAVEPAGRGERTRPIGRSRHSERTGASRPEALDPGGSAAPRLPDRRPVYRGTKPTLESEYPE